MILFFFHSIQFSNTAMFIQIDIDLHRNKYCQRFIFEAVNKNDVSDVTAVDN